MTARPVKSWAYYFGGELNRDSTQLKKAPLYSRFRFCNPCHGADRAVPRHTNIKAGQNNHRSAPARAQCGSGTSAKMK